MSGKTDGTPLLAVRGLRARKRRDAEKSQGRERAQKHGPLNAVETRSIPGERACLQLAPSAFAMAGFNVVSMLSVVIGPTSL